MSMLDSVTDRTRPIMQYVRDLEAMVRRYRNTERRFYAKWFVLGLGVGAASMSMLWLFYKGLRG